MLSLIVRPARADRVPTQTVASPDKPQPQSGEEPTLSRADLRNLAIIVAGFFAVLIFIPPQHEYPILDDWIYAGSVRDMLEKGRFIMPDMSQAILVGQTLWGALIDRIGYAPVFVVTGVGLLALAAFFRSTLSRPMHQPGRSSSQ